MKKIMLLLFFSGLLMCKSAFDKKNISNEVKNWLGQSVVDVLAEPEKVESFKVEGREGEGNTLAGFPITLKGPDLDKKQVSGLQAKLLTAGTYDFESQKRCVFTPGYGFQFQRGEKKVQVLVCLSCNEVQISYEKDYKIEDIDKEKDYFSGLPAKIFK